MWANHNKAKFSNKKCFRAFEIWPVFATNIRQLCFDDGDHLDNLRRRTSPQFLLILMAILWNFRCRIVHAGFDFHSVCYMDCNFCEVCKTNKLALLRAYRLRDFFSPEAIRQVIAVANRCGIVRCLFGNKNE
ncbi:hypothetical protein niasHT_016736 [Heterodera trifolii]|uniref:Uncharacterized protein n=1 Tax=Heterodera trifolii TaxID=157864 RepID=A0ABD2L6H3_9BILA